jgi:hypothetical protein
MTLNDFLAANASLSDADAASGYNALASVTVRAIPLDALGALLRKTGLMARLKALVADTQTPPEIRAALADFLDQLADVRAVNLDTTDAVIATRAAGTLAGLQAARLIDVDGVAAIYALGGGLVRPAPLTTEDVTAARASIARRAAANAMLAKLSAFNGYAQDAANRYTAGTADALPDVPDVP